MAETMAEMMPHMVEPESALAWLASADMCEERGDDEGAARMRRVALVREHAGEEFRMSDAGWDKAGLTHGRDHMEFVECGEDYGSWWDADDEGLVIYWGTYGNYNSPGASHYTWATIYSTVAEYRAALAEWEAKPEWDDEAGDDMDE